MRALTRANIRTGLVKLGLKAGDIVVLHSALSSLGRVQGGAKAVVDALLDVIGPQGTLLAPSAGPGRPYDFRKTPSSLGAITEEIRLRKNAVRSLSPCMPAVAIGPRAREFTAPHHTLECPYIGSPWHLAAQAGGYVLLLGVDQDRNTTLHVAEALVKAPYMGKVESQYVDEKGKVQTYRGVYYAGPHRDFIGIDAKLRAAGIMKVGRIGPSVARLMKGQELIDFCVENLKRDPAFFITPNNGYEDGIDQRGKIKADRLRREETFTLTARSGAAGRNTEEILWHGRRAGVSAIEADIVDGRDITRLTTEDLDWFKRRLAVKGMSVAVVHPTILSEAAFGAALKAAAHLGARAVVWPLVGAPASLKAKAAQSRKAKVELLFENVVMHSSAVKEMLQAIGPDAALAFNPGRFAAAGELPFLGAFRVLRRAVRYVALTDASPLGRPCLIGQGYGEVKEIISILRCSSWDGYLSLGGDPAAGLDFDAMTDAFYHALDNC
ncbi:MAG TPA: AAC(3) family N-acetyltransferase [Candidatus Brocadiia bacterium]|nr:AAC(3) family N-acetyltransferase [Candidatus Brocadiia bacterium]